MSIYEGVRQGADLIGLSLDKLFDRSRDGIVVQVNEPSDTDKDWFNALLQNKTIYFSDIGDRHMLMIRVDRDISTGINLDTGAYALGARTLEPGILFLARRHAGWEDPTGATVKKVNQHV